MTDDAFHLQPEPFYGRLTLMVKVVAALVLSLIVVPPVAGSVAVATLLKVPLPVGDLPDERPQITAVPSKVYDGDGRQIGLFRGFDRTVEVDKDEVPQLLKDAVVAIEDRRFWLHDGVDLEGIARAARTNIEVGGIAQGGSTLTQQYVKNVYLTSEQTLERKVEEALLATELEKQMSKEDILFGYLTSNYYGSGAYGIGAAAEIYFDKKVAQLDLSEAATLAGLLKAPTRLSPYQDRDAAEERRRLVLQAMLDQDYISRQDYERNVVRRLWSVDDGDLPNGPVTALIPRAKKGATAFPHFVDFVEQTLLEELGPDLVYQGGLTIETTINPKLQAAAEEAVAKRLENTEFPIEMALASIEPSTGHIVAMVAGRDYSHSQVNLATGGSTGFQPGSSFKPVVLAAAFNMGLGPGVTYPAPARWLVPGCVGGECAISNYDHRGYGNITLRAATRASVNTVYAQLLMDVTISDTVDLARKLGMDRIDPDRYYGASFSLGTAESSPLEMAAAYSVFANRGMKAPATGILRVLDAEGNVLIDNRAPAGERVLDTAVADNVTDVLVGVVNDGTGKAAQIGRPVAGKTGTAQAYRAAWFVGYTPQLSTAVWMGHADRLDSLNQVNGVRRVTGGSHPAVAFSDFMATAHEDLDVAYFPVPEEIVPIAESAQEVISFRVREQTVLGQPRQPSVIQEGCGGYTCSRSEASELVLPKPERPTTIPPPTTTPPTTSPTTIQPADGQSTTTGGSGSSSTPPTTQPAQTATSTKPEKQSTTNATAKP